MTFALALGVGVSACGDDGNQAAGDTETGTGTGTGTGGMTTAGMTTAGMSTTAGMTAGNDSSTGGPSDSTGMPSDSTGMPGDSSTGGGQTCEECGVAACGDQITECIGVKECACWLMCLNEGNEPMDCGQECMGPPPEELDPVQQCIDDNCTEACSDGGSTGGSSTGGGGSGGAYDQCDPLAGNDECPEPLACNMFLGYCTLEGCGNDNDCPDPGSGDVEPTCSQFDNCVLECDETSTCPDGMQCNMGGFGGFCGY